MHDARSVSDELRNCKQGIVAVGCAVVDEVVDRNARRSLALDTHGYLAGHVGWRGDHSLDDACLE